MVGRRGKAPLVPPCILPIGMGPATVIGITGQRQRSLRGCRFRFGANLEKPLYKFW